MSNAIPYEHKPNQGKCSISLERNWNNLYVHTYWPFNWAKKFSNQSYVMQNKPKSIDNDSREENEIIPNVIPNYPFRPRMLSHQGRKCTHVNYVKKQGHWIFKMRKWQSKEPLRHHHANPCAQASLKSNSSVTHPTLDLT